jgi:saccharopine dehydrogenase-like NADP-dependent oxidoreductase
MKSIVVLGAGLVGKAIALDLCNDYKVTSVDINSDNLKSFSKNKKIIPLKTDLSKAKNVQTIVKDFDLVIVAVPGFIGFETLKNVIISNKNVVDISFFPEDAFELDALAKKHKVTAVVDCGVAPGMSNFILGYHAKRMEVKNFEFMVGGLPVERDYPFQYKAPFSPVDVLEEYTRPARFVVNGKIVIKAPLSEPEYIHFDGIGTLEAFNTDGLRSLIKTMKIPNMKEKTLRYPGHIQAIQLLKDSGFFDQNQIVLDGKKIKPIDFSSKILFDKWKLNEKDEEFTVMRIIIEGMENKKPGKYIYDLLDRRDKKTGISSMSRTTGYTATAVANLVINNKFIRKGICPPEYIGEDEKLFKEVMAYLGKRGVIYNKQVL